MLWCFSPAVFLACVAGKRVYVHCTAGLGRAPAACIAYLYWVAADGSLREGSNWSLDKARSAPYRLRCQHSSHELAHMSG